MITLEVLVGWGVTGAALIGHVFVANYRIGKTETSVDQIWSWKNKHEQDTADTKEKYQAQISELKGSQLVSGEQFKQIMTLLQDLKERMIKLENK